MKDETPRPVIHDSSFVIHNSLSRLFDPHVHTELAGCAEDITAAAAVARARELNLSIGFAEHADQLYFPRADYAKHEIEAGKLSALRVARAAGSARFAAYRALVAPFRARGVPAGLEVEAAEDGPGLALLDDDRAGWDYLLGAVHEFRGMAGRTEPMADLAGDFLVQVEKLARARVQALAHPFRVFLRKQREVPRQLYRPVAEILAGHGVAAEINFHTNQPDPEFFALCLERGVKLSIGSDSHAMREVGALGPHLALLKTLGVADRLDAVLWRPCAKR
jgi:histidinol phosphatase-like PHP family hydrolase